MIRGKVEGEFARRYTPCPARLATVKFEPASSTCLDIGLLRYARRRNFETLERSEAARAESSSLVAALSCDTAAFDWTTRLTCWTFALMSPRPASCSRDVRAIESMTPAISDEFRTIFSRAAAVDCAPAAVVCVPEEATLENAFLGVPDGGTPAKPVGTVFIGLAVPGLVEARHFRFAGGRASVKWQSSQMALDMLRRALGGSR